MTVSAHAHLKLPNGPKTRPNWQEKIRFGTKPGTENYLRQKYNRNCFWACTTAN